MVPRPHAFLVRVGGGGGGGGGRPCCALLGRWVDGGGGCLRATILFFTRIDFGSSLTT